MADCTVPYCGRKATTIWRYTGDDKLRATGIWPRCNVHAPSRDEYQPVEPKPVDQDAEVARELQRQDALNALLYSLNSYKQHNYNVSQERGGAALDAALAVFEPKPEAKAISQDDPVRLVGVRITNRIEALGRLHPSIFKRRVLAIIKQETGGEQ